MDGKSELFEALETVLPLFEFFLNSPAGFTDHSQAKFVLEANQIPNHDPHICNATMIYLEEHPDMLIDKEDFVRFCANRGFCVCFGDIITPDQLLRYYRHFMFDSQLCITCGLIKSMHMFMRMSDNDTFPTDQELEQFMHNLHEITNNMEEYCQEHKIHQPTANLDKLRPKTVSESSNCSICQETVNKNETVYELPCGHQFHSDSKECLGDEGSILTWLEKNKTCPNCNQEVVLH